MVKGAPAVPCMQEKVEARGGRSISEHGIQVRGSVSGSSVAGPFTVDKTASAQAAVKIRGRRTGKGN